MEIQLKNVTRAHLVTIPKHKIQEVVLHVLWGILQTKTLPIVSCDTMDVNRVIEVLLALRSKPTIRWKVVTIAPVVRIPK